MYGAEPASRASVAEPTERQPGDDPSAAAEMAGRAAEEMRMLYICFGTGLTIGFFFLVYIVIAIASGEGHSFAPS